MTSLITLSSRMDKQQSGVITLLWGILNQSVSNTVPSKTRICGFFRHIHLFGTSFEKYTAFSCRASEIDQQERRATKVRYETSQGQLEAEIIDVIVAGLRKHH